jgi:hypothetical protein
LKDDTSQSLQHPVSFRYGSRADDQILPAVEDSSGEMAEWFKAFAWKADVWLIAAPRVRISLSPPKDRKRARDSSPLYFPNNVIPFESGQAE